MSSTRDGMRTVENDIIRLMTIEAPALPRPVGARYDRQFYTGMAIAAAVVVFVGFAPTFFLRASYQTTPLPTYLQVHGFLFTTWIALFIAQTSLVAARRTDVHRRLGWAMAALAVVMVVVGTTAGIWSMRGQVDAGQAERRRRFSRRRSFRWWRLRRLSPRRSGCAAIRRHTNG